MKFPSPPPMMPASPPPCRQHHPYIKEYNKDINNNIKVKSSLTNNEITDLFNLFWLAYPRKRKKIRANDIWKKNRLWEKYEEITQGLENLKKNCHRWLNGYPPDPDTFLRGERWNDAPVIDENIKKQETKPQETNEPAFDKELHEKLAREKHDKKMKAYIEEQKKNNSNFGNLPQKLENILKNNLKIVFKVP